MWHIVSSAIRSLCCRPPIDQRFTEKVQYGSDRSPFWFSCVSPRKRKKKLFASSTTDWELSPKNKTIRHFFSLFCYRYIMLLHHHETNKLIQVPPDPPSMKNTINYPPYLIILIILQLGCSLTHFIQEIIYRVPNARTSSVTGQLPSLFEDEMRANLFLKTQIMPLF